MLKQLFSWLLAATFLAGASAAHSGTDAATAESLMRSSGLWLQLEGVAPQARAALAAALDKRQPAMAEAEAERLLSASDAAYQAGKLQAAVRKTLADGLDSKHVPKLDAWFSSPSGKAFSKMEEATAQVVDPEQLMQDGTKLLAEMAPSRRARLQKMVELSRAAEALVSISLDTLAAAQFGVLSAVPGTPAPSMDTLRRALEAQRPMLVKAYADMALALYAAQYASASDPELGKYGAFMGSPAGRHFTDVGLRALSAALVEASQALGRGAATASEKLRT